MERRLQPLKRGTSEQKKKRMDINGTALSLALNDIRTSVGLKLQRKQSSPKIPYYHKFEDIDKPEGIIEKKPLIYNPEQTSLVGSKRGLLGKKRSEF